MEERREQVFVGLFVIIAVALLTATVFSLSGAFAGSARHFHAKFRNAAGLDRGTTVRYEGGPKIGRVEGVKIDPKDPTLMDMEFSVKEDLPIKTDSRVSILSFSPLGDNHLEVKAGSPAAPRAADGAILPSDPYVGFNDLTEEFNKVIPQAQELMGNLNLRVKELSVTLARVNDLLNDQNRANISASISDLQGMLRENRPVVKSTLTNVNVASAKLSPMLDDLRKTSDQANETLKKIDSVIGDNREDLRASIKKLRESLDNVSILTRHLNQTIDINAETFDELLMNLRDVSENLREFTDIIKTRPSELIRSTTPREHKPGEHQ
ncbi:MAG TPA: MlaD family protein [Candidatus Sulfotelmatobacter sp.]|jgi:phospholipid/cholesterol/gamma-HCH transport system substrate-binding protein|nr:MlaD family protein [Candidatus Sulfotelmatobacter sp.]